MITIYRFCLYDVRSDELVLSRRWGTRDAIARFGGQLIETTALETDEESILSDIEGLITIGFAPPAPSVIHPLAQEVVATRSIGS